MLDDKRRRYFRPSKTNIEIIIVFILFVVSCTVLIIIAAVNLKFYTVHPDINPGSSIIARDSIPKQVSNGKVIILKTLSDTITTTRKEINEEDKLLKYYDHALVELELKLSTLRSSNKDDSVKFGDDKKRSSLDIELGEKMKKYDFIPTNNDLFKDATVVLVFCYSRHDYLERSLKLILQNLPKNSTENIKKIRFVISQDGSRFPLIASVAETFLNDLKMNGFIGEKIVHEQIPQPELIKLVKERAQMQTVAGWVIPYARLSLHYEFGLNYVFSDDYSQDFKPKRVILLEDDMDVSVDFFNYFGAFSRLLDNDDSLYAISSWNDHGQKTHVKDPKRVYRTDFFPGLGWMMTRKLWNELKSSWPVVFWDDWMRNPSQRKGRQVIVPEICRTYNFGQSDGASHGQYNKFLADIQLNTEFVQFTAQTLDDLYPEKFSRDFEALIAEAKEHVVTSVSDINPNSKSAANNADSPLMITYSTLDEYRKIASQLKILKDDKAGVPRQAYNGVVRLWQNGQRLMIVPSVKR